MILRPAACLTSNPLGNAIVDEISTICHHHQPINVPTAGTQAFSMKYTRGEPSAIRGDHLPSSLQIFKQVLTALF
jgi:hypothetical protein